MHKYATFSRKGVLHTIIMKQIAIPSAAELWDTSHTLAAALITDITYPWELLDRIKDFIAEIAVTLDPEIYDDLGDGVYVARDAKIAPTAYIGGPCIIESGAEIRHCAYIRGAVIVGKGAVVGNSCELKNSILFDGVQVPHFNYVGDSVLGYKSHPMSRATKLMWQSNQVIWLWIPDAKSSVPCSATWLRSAATVFFAPEQSSAKIQTSIPSHAFAA